MTRYDMSGLPTFMPCISFFIRKYSCACKISTQPYRHLRVAGFYDMASRMAYITWTDLASEKLCDLSFWRPRYREHRLGCLYRVRFALWNLKDIVVGCHERSLVSHISLPRNAQEMFECDILQAFRLQHRTHLSFDALLPGATI